MHAEHAGENVGQQLARSNGAVAAHRVEADAERLLRQQVRIFAGIERHQLGFRIGDLQAGLQLGDARRRILGEELRAQVDQRRHAALLHVLEAGDQVARL